MREGKPRLSEESEVSGEYGGPAQAGLRENAMSDIIQDPYAGAQTDEERQAIYQNLMTRHEQITREYEHKKKVYEDFSHIWDLQRNIQLEADARFHKNILAITSGSFGVSFAFINQIIPLNEAFQTNFLFTAWIFFGISIVLSVLEPWIISMLQGLILNNIEKNIERGYDGKPYKEINKRLTILPMRIINFMAFLLFVSGVSCLLYFVCLNILLN